MNYKKWLDDFMGAWKEKDVKAVIQTISKGCEYYESVFAEPCASFEDIEKLWAVVPDNQRDIEYSYKILFQDENICVVNFFATRILVPSNVKQEINGIFQISLDEKGKCEFFKQWREVKES
ncbi:MAG: hypothetical protein KAQ63_02365 [Candidatus Moranbacteria bacterium]|nr:hypothetical protein [Candidatus Moranbacteria bacterium]